MFYLAMQRYEKSDKLPLLSNIVATANAYYFFHPLSFIAMFVYCHCMQAVGLQGMVAQGQVRSTATLGE